MFSKILSANYLICVPLKSIASFVQCLKLKVEAVELYLASLCAFKLDIPSLPVQTMQYCFKEIQL